MKKILLALFTGVASLGWSQNIVDVQYDNAKFCDAEFKTFVVTVFNNTGQTVTLNVPFSSNNSNLMIYSGPSSPDSVNTGANLEYYSFNAELYFGTLTTDQVVNGENFTISLYNDQGLPIGGTDYLVGDFDLYGPLGVTFDLSSVPLCSKGLPIDMTPYASPAGGTFNSLEVNETPAFDPKAYTEYIADGGEMDAITYEYTNTAGCSNMVYFYPTILTSPVVSISTTPSTCQNADGSATAVLTGNNNPPFQVYWSTGFSESVSTASIISNLSSGNYTCTVTDNVGCMTTGSAKVSDSDIIVTDVITEETCNGMNNGVIDLTVSSNGTVTDVFWSNGVTTEDMVGHQGEYFVEMHTDNNCNFYGTYTIPGSGLMFDLVNVSPFDCSLGGGQFIDIDTSSDAGIQTLEWTDASMQLVSTMADWTPPGPGVYTCTLTDNNGCSAMWDVTVPTSSGLDIYVDHVERPTCGNSDGSIDVSVYDFGDGPASAWQWSNGSTSEDLTNLSAGTYTLEYATASGCLGYITVDLPNEKPYQPTICLLTVDTSLIYNTVVWEKDPNQDVDGFNIYRETTVFGEFEKIASLGYNAHESAWVDNAASPADKSWRYYITSYDACGESNPSFIHKTIHTVANNVGAGTYSVSWDEYEGISYSTVDLWRYTDVQGQWVNIGTYAAGTLNTTDTPSDIVGLDYMVTFNLSSTCTSTKAQDWNSSRSNKTSAAENFEPGGQTDVGIVEMDANDGLISIYPNPTNGHFRIYVENVEAYKVIKIFNAEGQEIANMNIMNQMTEADLSHVAEGIYFIQLVSDAEVITRKVVKQ
ncbi:MAG: T9SS type A sorting domain-containing protein [Putridiphycobacter sp.]